jgi:hypothetical protein
MKFQNKKFGTVTIEKNSPYLKMKIDVNGRKSNCGLYISDDIAGYDKLEKKVEFLLDRIDELDEKARYILEDELKANNSLITEFIDFHLEEMLDEAQAKLGVDHISHELFIKSLDLKALGFHLNGNDIQCGFDYSIGEEFTDELLVVKFTSDAELIEVAHES